MKKLFIIFILIFSIFTYTFAFETKLKLSTDKVLLWDTFSIKVDIYSNENISLEDIKASWIWDFDVLWQSSSSSTRIINWKSEIFLSYDYKLLPQKIWIFQIWPFEITANWETKKTESFSIEVIWNEIKTNTENTNLITTKKINFFYIIVIFFLFISIFIYLKKLYYLKKENTKKDINLNKEENNIQNQNQKNINLNINDLQNARNIIFEFLWSSFWKDFFNMTFKEVLDFLKKNNYDNYKIKELEYIFEKLNIYSYSKNKQIEDDLIQKIKSFIIK